MDQTIYLKIKLLTTNATIPTRGSSKAAGLDLYSAESVNIPPKNRMLIKTDLQIKLPEGHYGRIAPKSGLTIKNNIDIGAGVVDEDFRGNLSIAIINNSLETFHIKIGMPVAQLICEKISNPQIKIVDNLDTTARGSKGFNTTLV